MKDNMADVGGIGCLLMAAGVVLMIILGAFLNWKITLATVAALLFIVGLALLIRALWQDLAS